MLCEFYETHFEGLFITIDIQIMQIIVKVKQLQPSKINWPDSIYVFVHKFIL